MPQHKAFYISNTARKPELIKAITTGQWFSDLNHLKGAIFSEFIINAFIEQELRHGQYDVKTATKNSLNNSSEGERKRALLNHILESKPDYIVLDNVFDCLDVAAQSRIKNTLTNLSEEVIIIQLSTRKRDILEFIDTVYVIENGEPKLYVPTTQETHKNFTHQLPQPYQTQKETFNPLIQLNKVSVSYGERPILNNITWQINHGEFWQLIGPNGSGKSTILSLISGDNPKGYMVDMRLFGIKKGSGETVWDIKKNIGFYTSEMLRGFKRRDTIESMIVSGFLDSVGLYKHPTDTQINIAHQWLSLLNMLHIKDKSFQFLSNGHKRLVLIARAMVKHPSLLILDEPTNGLDDADAKLFSELVNKIAQESETAIIYVSHRKEEFITPDFVFELTPHPTGSVGRQLFA
ncbi:ATP-binding cassette domain-containing protein [Algibacter amylolyticus]|uniref:ATP-binding cassette domain-containing protein n=1 Tax=Algibacter amylolyticus TaxID=1608400 RepID=A0A5M7B1V3_9FLAO|nr:ATP-binding cassette domain-containing protein [Algibacter amylolyticus]KAA5821171.1 ATP-binding cassette domain-containing protein [Algibacter amylolyticus]MBB5269817.1 molybdate transport system ATP-binding protein [Algibacter amylolyticus]TSJ72117.1 ATP-binding cassette domain-containing protein [Algibacter amylolyticus]